MALDGDTFVAKFPEWAEVFDLSPETITSAITDAKTYVDPVIWATRYEMGVLWKAADLLSASPFGEAARLKKDDRKSTYGQVFQEMQRALPVRMLVV